MNINDLPKKGGNNLPANFFENQFKTIVGRTLDIENWNLPKTKNIETQFKVPAGYWLKMEDGIRDKIKPKTLFDFSKAWQMATVLGSVLILIFASLLFFQDTKNTSDKWSARLDGLSSEELLLGIDIEKSEVQELTELIAATDFQGKLVDLQIEELNNQDIEESLENINSSELLNDLEIN